MMNTRDRMMAFLAGGPMDVPSEFEMYLLDSATDDTSEASVWLLGELHMKRFDWLVREGMKAALVAEPEEMN